MKKLLPLFVVSILVLGGIGAVAIPCDKPIENQPLSSRQSLLEIKEKAEY